jgi:hypothetical protein
VKKKKAPGIFPNTKWSRRGRNATDFLLSVFMTILGWLWRITAFICHLLFTFLDKFRKRKITIQKNEKISQPENVQDAVAALKALGVAPIKAEQVIAEAVQELGYNCTVQELIKAGLRLR